LLGRFELSGPKGPVELPNKKLAALLGYLACTASPQSRERLATLLWGSHFDAQARQSLRQAVFRLRRILGPGVLVGDGDEISLAPTAIESDVGTLKALGAKRDHESLVAAAESYQDQLLADVNVAEEAWTDWLAGERRRLESVALDAIIGHAEQALQSGDAEAALKSAERAIVVNALREDAHRLIIQALAAAGRKAEALKHYQDLTRLLAHELSIEPDAATKSLVAGLRHSTLAAAMMPIASKAVASPSGAMEPAIHQVATADVAAGRLALAQSKHQKAIDLFEQALAKLASLPPHRSTLQQAFDIRLELPQPLFQIGQARRALQHLHEAATLAEQLNDDRRRCRVLSFTTVVHALSSELDEALAAGTRSRDIARSVGEKNLIIPATTILEQVHFYRGEHERVVALAKENLGILSADLARESFGLATPPAVYDRGRLIISLAELGRFAEADCLESDTLRHATQAEHAYTVGWARLSAGWAHLLRGEWAQASPGLEHATAVLRAAGVVTLAPYSVGLSAWNLAQLGEEDEALSRLQEGERLLERHAESGQTGTLGWFYPWLGRAALVLGRLEDAERLAGRALAYSHRQPGFAAHALQLLADIASHPDRFDFDRSEGQYREALTRAESLGMRPVVAHCHLGLGRLYRRRANRRRPDEHLMTATRMYREMGMRFWLEEAEATRDGATLQAPPIPTVADKPFIAALPFRNMSGDPEQEYFADGVTEDIITALSRFHDLVVIARGSSFAFKGMGLTGQQIGRKLGVQYILDGSIRKSGNRVRVATELTDVESGVRIWSERYDRGLVDIFDLQDDISSCVAAVVGPAVRDAEIVRAHRKPPSNLSAYDLYLQALPSLWSGTREAVTQAIELLRRSLALDASRAPTLAALAWGLVMASPLGAKTSPEARSEAFGLARQAVDLDAKDAFAQAVYGYALLGPAGENTQGRVHSQEAVRLNPSSAFAWGTLGMIDSMAGDYENAIVFLERALALSPYDNMLHLWMTGLASACFALGRHEEGIAWARRSIQHNPGNGTGHRMLAANLAVAGHLVEARDVSRQRDTVQKTTIRELRAMRYFKQEDVLERYLAAHRMVGVAE